MALPNWEFPQIKKIKSIKSFNGQPEKLDDFTTSVEAFLYSGDYPLRHSGYVKPDGEGGYEFAPGVFPDFNAAAAANYRSNYNYGKKFCVMLAERLTEGAREWWITSGQRNPPNCWRPASAGQCPPNIVEVPFLHVLCGQFQDSYKHKMALLALDSLKWDSDNESVPVFRTCVTGLFAKAGITEFNGQRSYLLRAINDTLSHQVRHPGAAADFWNRLEEAVATEESIKANKTTTVSRSSKSSTSTSIAAGKKDMKELTCYTCNQKGHISPNCPENKDKKKDGTGNGEKREGKGKKKESTRSEDDVCYTCGSKGHRSPECPSKKTLGKKTAAPSSSGMTTKLYMVPHLDTRQESGFYYQSVPPSSFCLSPSHRPPPQNQHSLPRDDLGWYYYSMEPFDARDDGGYTEFYSFETLP